MLRLTQYQKVSLVVLIFLQMALPCFTQEKKEEKLEWIQFHGFVNYEVIYDTRQNMVAREGEVLLFPKPFEADKNGEDKNDHGKLSMFSLHTRIRADINEIEIYKMKASGGIEFDFIGTNDATLNLIRLRLAFIKLTATKFEWLMGQYWHPMFVNDCFPDVISWGAAAPIHVLNRSPQIRFTYFPNQKISLMGSISSQRDFMSSGPIGNSTEYLKNSKIPEMHFQLILKPTPKLVGGITSGYKVLVPRMVTDSGFVSKESLASYNFNVFGRFKGDKFDFKLEAIYGQNLSSLMLIGGYAVKKITDIQKNTKQYVNINSGSVWLEASYKIKDFRIGLFAGYLKNFGADSYIDQISEVYGLGTTVNYMYNFSPRIVYAPKKLKFAFELNNTAASFGNYNNFLSIINDKLQINHRFLFSASLNF